MRWALVFAGVVLIGAVALASREETWAAVCLTSVGLLAMWIDAAWHGGAVSRAAVLEAKIATLREEMSRSDREIVGRLCERCDALEQSVREGAAIQRALEEISHKRSANIATLEQQVDRLNKANAFKGL